MPFDSSTATPVAEAPKKFDASTAKPAESAPAKFDPNSAKPADAAQPDGALTPKIVKQPDEPAPAPGEIPYPKFSDIAAVLGTPQGDGQTLAERNLDSSQMRMLNVILAPGEPVKQHEPLADAGAQDDKVFRKFAEANANKPPGSPVDYSAFLKGGEVNAASSEMPRAGYNTIMRTPAIKFAEPSADFIKQNPRTGNAVKVLSDTLSGLTTQESLSIALATGFTGPIGQRLIALGFSVNAAKDAVQRLQALKGVTDPGMQSKLLTEALVSAGFAELTRRGAFHKEGISPEGRDAIRSADTLVLNRAIQDETFPKNWKALIDNELKNRAKKPLADVLAPVLEADTPQSPTPATDSAIQQVAQDATHETTPAQPQTAQTAETAQPKAPPEPAAPAVDATQPPSSRIVSTAIKTADGLQTGETATSSHADIMKGAVSKGVDATEGERGFTDENGNFINRTAAADIALKTGLIDQAAYDRAMARTGADKGLHSQDLPIEPPAAGQETATEVTGKQTTEIPLEKITLSKDVPQFKKGADEKGIVEPIAGKYERTGTAPVQLWERLDGSLELISGRHRFDLAERTGEKSIPSQIHREADGFTAQQAAMLDAELNIRDNQGSTADYASYFKHSEISAADAESRGLLARAKGKAGFSIAKNGSEDLFALHQSGRLTDSQAEAIASAAPDNPGAQQVGIRAALEGKSAEYSGNLIKAAATRPEAQGKTGDLFSFDDAAMQEMDAQAKIASEQQRSLREQISAVQGAAKKPEVAKRLGVDVKDPKAVQTRVQQLKNELARWQNWPMHNDLVAITRGQDVVMEPKAPKLAPGVEQGDLISSTQAEDLQLVGEKATDADRLQREQLQAEKDRADAAALEKEQQPDMFSDTTKGVKPEKDIVAKVPQAAPITPQALGITHPMPAFITSAVDFIHKYAPSAKLEWPQGKQLANSFKGVIDGFMGKTFPKTTIADRGAGEAGARWVSARIAAPHVSNVFAANVLDGTGIDPVRFGTALTEDNLRSIRQGFLDQARDAKTVEDQARLIDRANAVGSTIAGENSPFKTEADYQAFLNDPTTQSALERHRSAWAESVDPMYKQAMTIDPDEQLPARGEQTGARVNLNAVQEGDRGGARVSTVGQGNLMGTLRKKSPFGRQATGTGVYNTNYFDMMANTFGRQMEIAGKNNFEKILVEGGNAVIDKPGQANTIMLKDGEGVKEFPLRRQALVVDGQTIPQNQSIYIRNSLAREYRTGANVDAPQKLPFLTPFFNVFNRAALAGLTDATVHVTNLATVLMTRPGMMGSAWMDSLASISGRLDIPIILTKAVVKGFKDNSKQVAELAEIGALRDEHASRNPLANLIKVADKTTRLVLDDGFKNLVKRGLVENTETNRREFVNQAGQYNKRAQGPIIRFARDSGLAPFATAGRNFAALGIRTVTMNPGVEAASGAAAAALRANMLSKWMGAAVFVGLSNYMITGQMTGRPGTPLGHIDTGKNDKNGRPLTFDVLTLMGLGRGLRTTGIRGFVNSKRLGLGNKDAAESAWRDVANTAISPFAGPPVRMAFGLLFNQSPAIGVGKPYPVAAPGESQSLSNAKNALLDANPIIASIHDALKPGATWYDAVRRQLPRFTLSPQRPQEMLDKYPEIVRKAQAREYINDVIGRARKLDPDARKQFLHDALEKLAPEDRAQALKLLKYSGIEGRKSGGFTPREPGALKSFK